MLGMYITGNVVDFVQRLHQLPTGTNDTDSFATEGGGYLASIDANTSGQWEQIGRQLKYSLTNDADYLNQSFFS